MYKGGAIPKTRRQEERQKRALVVYFLIGAFVASGLIAGFWSIPRIPHFLIQHIEVSGNQFVSSDFVKKLVESELQGSEYIFFPRNNIFLFPKEEIKNAILNSNKRVLMANVSRGGINSIKVEIKERSPYAIVCKEFDAGANCFNADDEGLLYVEAPNYKTSSMPRFYSVSSTTVLRLGDQFLIGAEFKAFVSLSDKLKKAGLVVDRINIKDSESELVITDVGKLIVNKEQNMDIAFENFKTLIESKDFKEKVGEQLRFEYIDLRFGNKLFYKI